MIKENIIKKYFNIKNKIRKKIGMDVADEFFLKKEILLIRSLNFSFNFDAAFKKVSRLILLIERSNYIPSSNLEKEINHLKNTLLINSNCYESKFYKRSKKSLINPYVRSGVCSISVNERNLLTIKGYLNNSKEIVFIFINDRLMKSVMPNAATGQFKYVFSEFTTKGLPRNSRINLFTQSGSLDASFNKSNIIKFENKKIDGLSVFEHQEKGCILNKKGHLVRPGMLGMGITEESQLSETLRKIYLEYKNFFKENFGYDLWLIYGSLLGASRDGKAICHDDDFDIAYLSKYSKPEDVKNEVLFISRYLADNGFDIGLSINGIIKPKEKIAVDIYPSWIRDGRFYCQISTGIEMNIDDIYPLKKIDFCGVDFLAPKNSDKFLCLKYGKDWRIPDPSYKTYTPDHAKEDLLKAKLTIEERGEIFEYVSKQREKIVN